MTVNRSRFVLACQQTFALAMVAAVGLSAVGVVQLEIVAPGHAETAVPARSGAGALVSAAPVEPEVRTVRLDGRATARSSPDQSGSSGAGAQGNRVVSDPEPVSGYATVGVTWSAADQRSEEELAVSVRTRTGGGWSPWQELHHDPDHAPEPGETRSGVRAGTDAVVVGRVRDVQVRVTDTTGAVPRGLALALVDPGEDPAPVAAEPAIDTATLTTAALAAAPATATLRTGAPAAVTPQPQIFSRAQWGADERLRSAGSLRYGEIHAGFVHHTVNANDYTQAQVPAIIRGIYAYHTRSRGWSDLGYNFLVDRFGQIWEGRYGGVDRPVVGAHTLGYNDHAFAMSAIGNFETARPSQAMLDAYGRLMAWKLSLHGVSASSRSQVVAGRTFPAVNGHRDAGSTACPGRYLYERLGEIRSLAASLQRPFTTRDRIANLSGSSWPDLVVRNRTNHRVLVVRTGGQLGYLAGTNAAEGWKDVDLLAAPGDLDGDGYADLLARSTTGATGLYRGSAGGGVQAVAARTYDRFAGLDQLTGVGDLDGDGHPDVVGREASSRALLLFPGDGRGGFGAGRVLAADWAGYDLTAGVDDFDGDGHVDLVARSGSALYLVPGTGAGLGPRRQVPGDWSGYDVLAGRGDATGDGRPDLVARDPATKLVHVLPGDGAGGVGARLGGWSKFRAVRGLTLAGQLAGTGHPDLVGINVKTGRLRLFASNGRSNIARTVRTGLRLEGIDLLLNAGDLDGDGRGDLLTRDRATGALHFRAGVGQKRYAAPVVAGTGWGSATLVAPAGDVTGDGYPDVMARWGSGEVRIHPGDGTGRLRAGYLAKSSVTGDVMLGLGRWDGDGAPDVAVRRSDGSLWAWSGNGPGGLTTARQIGSSLGGYDWLRGYGDLDGDGHPDVVGRERSTGDLYLLPGRADRAGLKPRWLIGSGFGRYDLAG